MSGKHKPKPYKKRFCIDCGKELEKSRGNAAKRCADCQKFVNAEATNTVRWERRRGLREQQAKSDSKNNLGTGTLSAHMKLKKDGTPDWEAEAKAIKNEFKHINKKPKHKWDGEYRGSNGCSDFN